MTVEERLFDDVLGNSANPYLIAIKSINTQSMYTLEIIVLILSVKD